LLTSPFLPTLKPEEPSNEGRRSLFQAPQFMGVMELADSVEIQRTVALTDKYTPI